jgi:hypothetical protein
MSEVKKTMSRRALLARSAAAVTGIGLATIAARTAAANGRTNRDDWFYQEAPNADGKMCRICANFTAKNAGTYGPDSGACTLIDDDVSGHGYCMAWSINPIYGGG